MAKKQPVPENDFLKAARDVRATPVTEVFAEAAAARPQAVRILAEGDSWFAYPKSSIVFGRPSNVIDALKAIKDSPDLVIQDLSSNGDEAVAMLCGDSKLDLLKRLGKQQYDVLLFSGGGNDIVGVYDFEYFLNEYRDGFTAADCIRMDRFERRLNQIQAAYYDLIELVGDYSANPAVRIISHTYDVPEPSPQGAEFFGGLLRIDGAKSWMYPYLMKKKITDPAIQKEVVRYMLTRFRDILRTIAMRPGYAGKFIVVDTHGLIAPNEWLNEIHPNPAGFAKVANKIFHEAIKPLANDAAALPRVAAARAAAAAEKAPTVKPAVAAAKPARRTRHRKATPK